MSESVNKPDLDEKTQALKTTVSIVYICQVLTFIFAGLPLLVGVLINFMKRQYAAGTWLESHFNWQIKTAWITLAGFALTGLTYVVGLWVYILFPTLAILAYRIAVGWTAMTVNKPIREKDT